MGYQPLDDVRQSTSLDGRVAKIKYLEYCLALIDADSVQNNFTDEGSADNQVLEELIIAAQKRPENLQDIPVAAQVVSSQALAAANVADLSAFQHSRAARISLELRYDEQQFRPRVLDDGKGIDEMVLAEGEPAGYYGLRGMRERADLVGGKLILWGALDSGTEVELMIAALRAYSEAPAPEREVG